MIIAKFSIFNFYALVRNTGLVSVVRPSSKLPLATLRGK
jgi:hypothetical protein